MALIEEPSIWLDISVLELMAKVSEVREDILDMDMVSNLTSAMLELLKDVSCMVEAIEEKLSCSIMLCSIMTILDSPWISVVISCSDFIREAISVASL